MSEQIAFSSNYNLDKDILVLWKICFHVMI